MTLEERSPATRQRVEASRILVVGAGGIGCELLKNLVLSGFNKIDLLDLDTIDLSNLNRQFLFQKQHINQSKSQVAKESALYFNPNVDITAHHANIKEPKYNVRWFGQFDIVMNALDNLDARRHVNMMCVAANVPLIESGTAGYDGQVSFHWKGKTQCFDCSERQAPKTYPVCTIRSTPSAPIHCVVWAKNYLFAQLFGPPDEEEQGGENEDAEEIAKLKEEARALQALRQTLYSTGDAKPSFKKVFCDDIRRLTQMEEMWQHRQKPVPCDMDTLQLPALTEEDDVDQHKQWSMEEATHHLLASDSASRLAARAKKEEELNFDKDDEDAMLFVASAATVRSKNWLLKGDEQSYVSFNASKDRIFFPEAPPAPKPDCAVCSSTYVPFEIDVNKATLGALAAFGEQIGLGDALSINEGTRLMSDPDFDDNLEKTLTSLGLHDQSMLQLNGEDEDENGQLTRPVILILQHAADELVGKAEGEVKLTKYTPPAPKQEAAEEEQDDDDVLSMSTTAPSLKRKEAEVSTLSQNKKIRTETVEV